jgi:hypothetical protein
MQAIRRLMGRPKKAAQHEPLKVVSVKLTPGLERMLARLSTEATDMLGRPTSRAAILRGLVVYAGRQLGARNFSYAASWS